MWRKDDKGISRHVTSFDQTDPDALESQVRRELIGCIVILLVILLMAAAVNGHYAE